MEIQAGIPVLPARVERKISAVEAAKQARGGGQDVKRYRIGLQPLHPNFSATFGGLAFHKITEHVSNGGMTRFPVKGQILSLTTAQVQAALEDARFKMVRAIGGWEDPIRVEEYDVRRVAANSVQPGDLPILFYEGPLDQPVDIAKVDWSKSLIYFENDPEADVPPPADYEAAIRKMHENIERQFAIPTLTASGAVGSASQKGASADAATSRAMKGAKDAGVKVSPGGEVRS